MLSGVWQIDGTFRIKTPLAPLGYKHDPSNTRVDADMTMNEKAVNSTYLTMFITIEPPLTPAEPIREKVSSNIHYVVQVYCSRVSIYA